MDALPDNIIVAPDDAAEPAGTPGATEDDAPPIATRGTIVLDPSHGGTARAGASSPNNATGPLRKVLEKDLALRIAKLVQQSLAERASGVRVELTRTADINLDLADRARIARDLRADLFLSIHFNGFDGKARGVETLVRPKATGNVNHPDDRRFAARVLGAVHAAIQRPSPRRPSRRSPRQHPHQPPLPRLLARSRVPRRARRRSAVQHGAAGGRSL